MNMAGHSGAHTRDIQHDTIPKATLQPTERRARSIIYVYELCLWGFLKKIGLINTKYTFPGFQIKFSILTDKWVKHDKRIYVCNFSNLLAVVFYFLVDINDLSSYELHLENNNAELRAKLFNLVPIIQRV